MVKSNPWNFRVLSRKPRGSEDSSRPLLGPKIPATILPRVEPKKQLEPRQPTPNYTILVHFDWNVKPYSFDDLDRVKETVEKMKASSYYEQNSLFTPTPTADSYIVRTTVYVEFDRPTAFEHVLEKIRELPGVVFACRDEMRNA